MYALIKGGYTLSVLFLNKKYKHQLLQTKLKKCRILIKVSPKDIFNTNVGIYTSNQGELFSLQKCLICLIKDLVQISLLCINEYLFPDNNTKNNKGNQTSLEVTTKETVRNLEHRLPYHKISLSENKMVSQAYKNPSDIPELNRSPANSIFGGQYSDMCQKSSNCFTP